MTNPPASIATPILPLGFGCPKSARLGTIGLQGLVAAVANDDRGTVSTLRGAFVGDRHMFDQFAAGLAGLVRGDWLVARNQFAEAEASSMSIAARLCRALATAAAGDLGQAIALANLAYDQLDASGDAGDGSYAADSLLLAEIVSCLQRAEAREPPADPPAQESVRSDTLFAYVISYPRSGNTYLTQYLSHAFEAPRYSVFPADGRYFSRRFHDPAPGHAVFVKEHFLSQDYLADPILFLVRDGRDAMLSFARYLHAERSNPFVRRGELADFLTHATTATPFGFWGDHTRKLLDARDKGAGVRLVRYEDIFGNYAALSALGRELAGAAPGLQDDEAAYNAFVAREKRKLAIYPQWSEAIPLPEDSYIAHNWSIGGATLDWRSAFDGAARRRFHELGGTEMLIRLGYETDDNWWRRE